LDLACQEARLHLIVVSAFSARSVFVRRNGNAIGSPPPEKTPNAGSGLPKNGGLGVIFPTVFLRHIVMRTQQNQPGPGEHTRKREAAEGRGSRAMSRADLTALLGDIDDDKFAEILRLDPSLSDIEQAVIWARGEGEVLGKSGHPLLGKAARIFEIVTADEDEEPAR
jgi:hypothetical protein